MKNALHRGSAGVRGMSPSTRAYLANAGTGASPCAPLVTDDLDTALVQRCGLSCAGSEKWERVPEKKYLTCLLRVCSMIEHEFPVLAESRIFRSDGRVL